MYEDGGGAVVAALGGSVVVTGLVAAQWWLFLVGLVAVSLVLLILSRVVFKPKVETER